MVWLRQHDSRQEVFVVFQVFGVMETSIYARILDANQAEESFNTDLNPQIFVVRD